MTKKTIVFALAFIACMTRFASAQAADWTGFYVGANGGYAWGDSDVATSATCGTFIPFYFHCGNQGVVQASGTGPLSPERGTAGVQAGYNWQNGQRVLGVELDFGAFNLEDSRTRTSAFVAVVPGVSFQTNSSITADWLVTARGRIGWTATPNVLVYATGGLAVTEIKVTNSFRDANGANFGSGAGSGSDTKLGWSIGGGVEWVVVRNWSVKAEYLYVNFGDVSASSVVTAIITPSARSLLTTSGDLRASIARVGLNYRF